LVAWEDHGSSRTIGGSEWDQDGEGQYCDLSLETGIPDYLDPDDDGDSVPDPPTATATHGKWKTFRGGGLVLHSQTSSREYQTTSPGHKSIEEITLRASRSSRGGGLLLHTQSASRHTTTPGHKYVDEIVLRGPMTSGRKALMDWIQESAGGRQWFRDLTITELLSVDGAVKPGKAYEYKDVFPVGYVFPRMSVTNVTGNVMEEVAIKPIRCELK
jgi:hypothetical protein